MKKIGILSPCGTGNLGDEATVAVLVDEIKRRCPHAEVYGLTSNPADTRERHKIPAYPARNISTSGHVGTQRGRANTIDVEDLDSVNTAWKRIKAGIKNISFLYSSLKMIRSACHCFVSSVAEIGFVARSLKTVKGTDLLIVAGSGQLCDNFYGPWGFPYTLLKWSMIAKLSRARLAFVSCGAGPIDSTVSRIFIKCALWLADYRSFRDQESKDLIEKIGIHGNHPVLPDLVFGSKPHVKSRLDQSRIVAINPFPHCDYRYWPVSVPDAYSSYISRLASFSSWLIKNKFTVLFFATQLRADPLVIEDIKSILTKDKSLDLDKHLLVKTIGTVDELIAQLSVADTVVASRFHGVLLSLLMNKPVLALSHHPKVANLMRDTGQSDYLLDIDTFDVPTLTNRLMSLDSKRDAIRQQIKSKVAVYQQRLEAQYRDLFGVSAEGAHGVLAVSQ